LNVIQELSLAVAEQVSVGKHSRLELRTDLVHLINRVVLWIVVVQVVGRQEGDEVLGLRIDRDVLLVCICVEVVALLVVGRQRVVQSHHALGL
jgi:hypothetical protein